MKRFLLISALFQLSLMCDAQVVLNVRAIEEDGTIIILYDLYTAKTDNEFYVTVRASKDGGKIFSPLYEIIGDANKNVRPGTDRTVVWRPPHAPGDSVVFKVDASPQRSNELINPNEGKKFFHESGNVSVTRIVRMSPDVEFTFSLEGFRRNSSLFVAANFSIVDESGKTYQTAEVVKDAKIGPAISCPAGTTSKFKVIITGVPENVTRFTKVNFSLSEIPVTFSDLKIEQ